MWSQTMKSLIAAVLLPAVASAFSAPALSKVSASLVCPPCRPSVSSSALFVGREIRLEDASGFPQRRRTAGEPRAATATTQPLSTTAPAGATTPSSFTESPLRSAVKSFSWRLLAGSITLCASLRFSSDLATALSIVGSDFVSKSFTMFVGERLMNRSHMGRRSGSDDVGRSLIKALVWRLFAIANTLTMAVFFAKDWSVASKIVGLDAIFKTSLMFGYERMWAKIQWGKQMTMKDDPSEAAGPVA